MSCPTVRSRILPLTGKWTTFLILQLAGFGLRAQQPLTLQHYLQYALQHSPQIASQQFEQRESQIALKDKSSQFLPQVDAYLNYTQYPSGLPTYFFPPTEGAVLSSGMSSGYYPVPLGLPYNLNTGISLNQSLFDMNMFGASKIKANYQALDELKLEKVQEEVIYQVSLNYYQISSNVEKESVIQYNLDRLLKVKGLVALQVQQGFAKETDLQKLTVKTANLRTNEQKLRAGIQLQLGYLKLLIGMSTEDSLDIGTNVKMPDSLVVEAINENIRSTEREIMERQQQLNALNEKHIQGRLLPKTPGLRRFNFPGPARTI